MPSLRIHGLFALALLTLMFGACGDETTIVEAPAGNQGFVGSVSGRVYSHPSGDPIGSATIEVLGTDIDSVSDPNGYFRFKGIAPGSYELLVSAGGHATTRVRLYFERPAKAPEEIHLVRNLYLIETSGSLSVTVQKSTDGSAIEGAQLSLSAWRFPEEAHYSHQLEDADITAELTTDANGVATAAGLPATTFRVVLHPVDLDGDGHGDLEASSKEVRIAPGATFETDFVAIPNSDAVRIIASNASQPYYDAVVFEDHLYFVFSRKMDTSANSINVVLREYYGQNEEIPVGYSWTSDIRLEIFPSMNLIEPDSRLNLTLQVRDAAGAGAFFNYSRIYFALDDGIPPSGGDCTDLVTGLAFGAGSDEFDYDTHSLSIEWNAVACSRGYEIYARDDYDNPNWVWIKSEPSDYETGIISTHVSLPESFDRYTVDEMQTALAGISVEIAVVPSRASDPDPEVHARILVQDVKDPRVRGSDVFLSERDPAGNPSELEIRVQCSEYLSAGTPTLEVREAGGDPGFHLDGTTASWDWTHGGRGYLLRIPIPAGMNPEGDEYRVVVLNAADLSGNASAGEMASEWAALNLSGPFFDFEGDSQGWYVTGTTAWEWGEPQSYSYGPNSAYNSDFCWITGLNKRYAPYSDSVLQSPLLLVPSEQARLAFVRFVEIESTDTFWLEIDHAGGISPIADLSAYSPGWAPHELNLEAYAGQAVRFRFHFTCGEYAYRDGVAIDAVELYSAAP